MDAQRWEPWLLSPRLDGWPTQVAELLPREVASACLVIHNDPLAEHPLDASGFLSLDRLDALIEALMGISSADWMIAYWDGWSGIGRPFAKRSAIEHSPCSCPSVGTWRSMPR